MFTFWDILESLKPLSTIEAQLFFAKQVVYIKFTVLKMNVKLTSLQHKIISEILYSVPRGTLCNIFDDIYQNLTQFGYQ